MIAPVKDLRVVVHLNLSMSRGAKTIFSYDLRTRAVGQVRANFLPSLSIEISLRREYYSLCYLIDPMIGHPPFYFSLMVCNDDIYPNPTLLRFMFFWKIETF